MKRISLLSAFWAFSFFPKVYGQTLLNNLYYCNERLDPYGFYMMSDSYFLMHVSIGNNNHLILFNKERIPTDTLLIGNNQTHFLQNLIPYGEHEFFMSTLSSHSTYRIVADSLYKLETVENRFLNNEGNSSSETSIRGQYIKVNDVVFIDEPIMKGVRHLGFRYWMIKSGQKILLEETKLNKNRSGLPFLPSYVQYDATTETLLKMIPESNHFYIINANTLKIKTISFDSIGGSNFVFYDRVLKRLYLVNYKKKESSVFWLNPNTNELKLILSSKYQPKHIANDYLYFESSEIDGVESKGLCLFRSPLFSNGERIILMDEVIFKVDE